MNIGVLALFVVVLVGFVLADEGLPLMTPHIYSDLHRNETRVRRNLKCHGECAKEPTSTLMQPLREAKLKQWMEYQQERYFSEGGYRASALPENDFDNTLSAMPNHNVFPIGDIEGSSFLNDIWGWTGLLEIDQENTQPRDIAIVCSSTGTGFIDVTQPSNMEILGFLPAPTAPSSWRDAKVYKHYAFIVSEATGSALQIVDLKSIVPGERMAQDGNGLCEAGENCDDNPNDCPFIPGRNKNSPSHCCQGGTSCANGCNCFTPSLGSFDYDFSYDMFSRAHNIVSHDDPEKGFMYVVGSNTCSGGLHAIDIRNIDPSQDGWGIEYLGCFSDDGYTHDAQCVTYHGPDTRYTGRDICFAFNEDTVTIVDVTLDDNGNWAPKQLSRLGYTGSQYCHQGGLTLDHQSLAMGDELDERRDGIPTTTYFFDVSDLEAPSECGRHTHTNPFIDHNMYIHERNGREFLFQSNYCGGIEAFEVEREINVEGVVCPVLDRLGHTKHIKDTCGAEFLGSWSNYLFESGTVVFTDMYEGMVALRTNHLYDRGQND